MQDIEAPERAELPPGPDGAPAAAAPPAPAQVEAPAPVAAPARSAVEMLEDELAFHVGPVAKVMVKIAAQRAGTPEALCDNLALRIADPDARADFKERAYAIFGLEPPAVVPAPSPMVVHPPGVTGRQPPPPASAPADLMPSLRQTVEEQAVREREFVRARRAARHARIVSGMVIVLLLGLGAAAYFYFVRPDLFMASTRAARDTLGGGVMSVGTAPAPGILPAPMMNGETYESTLNTEMRREIQRGLTVMRFYSGPIDGDFGRATRSAIRAYQQATGQMPTGTLDSPLVQDLLNKTREGRRTLR